MPQQKPRPASHKQAILTDQGLAAVDQHSAIEALLDSRFSTNERVRVSSLLDMAAD